MTANTLKFHARTVPTVIVVIFAPLFFGLGMWQLDRAEQKRNIAASLEMRRNLPVLPITDQLPDADQLKFRRVIAEGRFLSEKTVLIENRKYQGETGFHVITPLLIGTGEVVLVNRGWIPGRGQGIPPGIPKPEADLIIEGEVVIPLPPALELSLQIDREDATPRWPYLTLEHYAAWSGLDIKPFMILQAAQDSSGFMRRWPQPRANDAMHIGYAVQWFAFSLIALLIWLRLSIHKTTGNSTDV